MTNEQIEQLNASLNELVIGEEYIAEMIAKFGEKPSLNKIFIKTDKYWTEGKKVEPTKRERVVRAPSFLEEKFCGPDEIVMDYEYYEAALSPNADWLEVIKTIDTLVENSGDLAHRYFEGLEIEGDAFSVILGS